MPPHLINNRYDPVVNGLNFMEIDTPFDVLGDINFDSSVYDKIEKQKKYYEFIMENYVEELVTFGKEYLK